MLGLHYLSCSPLIIVRGSTATIRSSLILSRGATTRKQHNSLARWTTLIFTSTALQMTFGGPVFPFPAIFPHPLSQYQVGYDKNVWKGYKSIYLIKLYRASGFSNFPSWLACWVREEYTMLNKFLRGVWIQGCLNKSYSSMIIPQSCGEGCANRNLL